MFLFIVGKTKMSETVYLRPFFCLFWLDFAQIEDLLVYCNSWSASPSSLPAITHTPVCALMN